MNSEIKFSVSAAINGISINGDEYLLDEKGNLMLFESIEEAKDYLRFNGYSDEMIEDLNYHEEGGMIIINNESGIDHELTDDIVCPYCGYTFRDSWDYGINESSILLNCNDCDKSFYANQNISITYTTEKANYGMCSCCNAENVVIEDYISTIGHLIGMCQSCLHEERRKLMKKYAEEHRYD